MALILIRATSNKKILNTLADLERHADLKILGNPKILKKEHADEIAENILKIPLKTKTIVAVGVHVEESTTLSIMRVKKIHPPAHVIVISDEYSDFEKLSELMNKAPKFKGYYSNKENNSKDTSTENKSFSNKNNKNKHSKNKNSSYKGGKTFKNRNSKSNKGFKSTNSKNNRGSKNKNSNKSFKNRNKNSNKGFKNKK